MRMLNRFFANHIIISIIFTVVAIALYIVARWPSSPVERIWFEGDTIYLSTGQDGLRILEIDDNAAIAEIGYYDTLGYAGSFAYQDGRLYLSEGWGGITILNVQEPQNIRREQQIRTRGRIFDVAVKKEYLILATGERGLQVYTRRGARYQLLESASLKGNFTLARLVGDELWAANDGHLQIYNAGDPVRLSLIGEYIAPGQVRDIAIQGQRAALALDAAGIVILDISNLKAPRELGRYNTEGLASSIALRDIHAFVADGPGGLIILDVSDPLSIFKVGKIDTYEPANLVIDRQAALYVAAGNLGLIRYDLTVMLGLDKSGSIGGNERIKAAVSTERFGYVAAGEGGLKVIDITNPSAPQEIYTHNPRGDIVTVALAGDLVLISNRVEGIQILQTSQAGGALHLLGEYKNAKNTRSIFTHGNTAYLAREQDGIELISFENPQSPHRLGSYNTPGTALGVYLIDKYLLVAAGEAGLRLLDVSDPEIPTEVGSVDTPGYAHAVYAYLRPEIGQTIALVADGCNGLGVFNITNPRVPFEIATFRDEACFVDLAILGQYAYLAAEDQGIFVVDFSNPAALRQVHHISGVNRVSSIFIHNNRLLASDPQFGLQILNILRPGTTVKLGLYHPTVFLKDVVANPNYAFVIDELWGIRAYRISDIAKPVEVGAYKTENIPLRTHLAGNHLYVMQGDGGITILDVTDPAEPAFVNRHLTNGQAAGIAIQDHLAYIANGTRGLEILDIQNPTAITRIGSFSTRGLAQSVAIDGKYAFVATGDQGVWIGNVSSLPTLIAEAQYKKARDARKIVIHDHVAYIADGENGLLIVDIARPLAPQLLEHLIPASAVVDVEIVNAMYAILTEADGGIRILDIAKPANPALVGYINTLESAWDGHVLLLPPEGEKPGGFRLLVAGGQAGLHLYDARKTPIIRASFHINTPGLASYGSAMQAFIAWFTGTGKSFPQKIVISYQQILSDWALFGLSSFFFWAFFFSQQILPLKKLAQQKEAFLRLVDFAIFHHGPFTIVLDGAIVHQHDRKAAAGGVIRADLSSAVVIEKTIVPYPQPITLAMMVLERLIRKIFRRPQTSTSPRLRIEGPGITFTKYKSTPFFPRYYEKVREAVDLRNQVRLREDVRVFTADGVELKTDVVTVFTLGDPPEIQLTAYDGERTAANLRMVKVTPIEAANPGPDGISQLVYTLLDHSDDELDEADRQEIHTKLSEIEFDSTRLEAARFSDGKTRPYLLNRKRIFNALRLRAMQASTGQPADWKTFPTDVAVQIFRNLIATEAYNRLFEPDDPEEFPLKSLMTRFRKTVRNQGVLAYQFICQKNGQDLQKNTPYSSDDLLFYPVQELTNPKILRNRGLKIVHAGFTELAPVDPEVRERLFTAWRAHWEKENLKKWADYDLQARRIMSAARVQAQQDMLYLLSNILNNTTLSEEALTVRIYQALELAAADPQTQKFLPHETIQMMSLLRRWITPDGLPDDLPGLPPGTLVD